MVLNGTNPNTSEGTSRFIEEETEDFRERILKTFLDLIVLARTSQIGYMKIPWILDILETEYGLILSPGTIYPLFCRLEEKGFLQKMSNRPSKIYILTDKGKKALENFANKTSHLETAIAELTKILGS